jgi:hypothetical protein
MTSSKLQHICLQALTNSQGHMSAHSGPQSGFKPGTC